eukprot:6189054-Pleurochrysis_carterae.AAC.1
MAPPVAGAPASTDWSCMHTMSLEEYEYVFDWAAIIRISTIDPLDGEAYGLLCFATPKGYSTHAGLPPAFPNLHQSSRRRPSGRNHYAAST